MCNAHDQDTCQFFSGATYQFLQPGLELNFVQLRNLKFSQIRTSKSTRSWPKVKKPRIIQSPIRIWIPARTLVSILTITFDSIIRLSLFKLGWKSDMMGYKYVSNDYLQIRIFRGSKWAHNQSLKISQNFGIFMKYIQFPKP